MPVRTRPNTPSVPPSRLQLLVERLLTRHTVGPLVMARPQLQPRPALRSALQRLLQVVLAQRLASGPLEIAVPLTHALQATPTLVPEHSQPLSPRLMLWA